MEKQPIWNRAVVLWRCDRCKLWWYSKPTNPSGSWEMIRLADPVLDPAWEIRCPIWKISGPDPSVCPECAAKMKWMMPRGQADVPIFQQGLLSSLIN